MIVSVECPRCCGNGQTFGPNSGEDIVCPDCGGIGTVAYDPEDEIEDWMSAPNGGRG